MSLIVGDLIVAIEVPASVEKRASHYLKVRDRASYEFALVSAAHAAVATDGGRISSARLAMGGVAHKPWRLTAAETGLRGVSLADVDGLRSAIATSFGSMRARSRTTPSKSTSPGAPSCARCKPRERAL